MIKQLLFGIWVCIVVLGSTYAGVMLTSEPQGPKSEASSKGELKGLQTRKTRAVAVPIVRFGRVQGYVLAEFAYSGKEKVLKKLSVPPDVPIIDHAIRYIYSDEKINFDNMKKTDLGDLTTSIRTHVNTLYGSELVKTVMVDSLRFLPASQVRSNKAKQ